MQAKVLGILRGGLAFLPGFELCARAESPNILAELLEEEADAQPVGRSSATQAPANPAPAAAPPTPAAAAGPKRLAAPPAAELKDALAKVQDLFSAGYATVKTADAKAKLATQLASHAGPDQPPAARTALLPEAVRLAVEAGDVNFALKAAGKMIDAFDVDRDAAILEVFQSLLPMACPDAARHNGQIILKFVDEAIRGRRYKAAEKAVPVLVSVSRKARDRLLVKPASAPKLRLAEKAALEGRLAPLRAKLAESPDGPQANLEVGQLLHFTADNWNEGLRYPTKVADKALVAIANAEAKAGNAPDPRSALSLPDGWFDWSQGQKGPCRTVATERSLNYYLAASRQVTALQGVRLRRQIALLAKNTGYRGSETPLI